VRGSVSTGEKEDESSTGEKEDESSTGRIWATGFHHVTVRSLLAGVLKLTNPLFI
jgi:hypothetical protein